MKTTRLLLPFTHGVDMEALEFAVLLAKDRQATLVPLALVSVPNTRWSRGARLEHIQQAKDFLEAAQCKAAKHDVSMERFEVFTSDAMQSTHTLVQQLECDSIVLFARGSNSILLSTNETRRLMEKVTCMFYIVRLPVKRHGGLFQLLREYLPSWIARRRKVETGLIPSASGLHVSELRAFASELHPTWENASNAESSQDVIAQLGVGATSRRK